MVFHLLHHLVIFTFTSPGLDWGWELSTVALEGFYWPVDLKHSLSYPWSGPKLAVGWDTPRPYCPIPKHW